LNKARNVSVINVKVPPDVRKKLEEWAADNLTSMTAEFIRSARERATREAQEKTG
jgi:hypothetical protein